MKLLRIGLSILALSLNVFLVWHLTPKVHAEQDNTVSKRPEKLIDEKFRAVNPNDSGSIRALADAVFAYPHVVGRMPLEMETALKNRLVVAEAHFLQGKSAGVREEDIV